MKELRIFFPGDMVREIKTNQLGIVDECHFHKNLSDKVDFSGRTIGHGDSRFYKGILECNNIEEYMGYAVEGLPLQNISKNAWYDQDELEIIKRGPYSEYIIKLLEERKNEILKEITE